MDKPILLSLDSAHDAHDNRDFPIKWNRRKQDLLDWADKAQSQKAWNLNS
jgi:hypothetical protein